MKLTLLKWKYQIVQEPRQINSLEPWFVIYKAPYGLLSCFMFKRFIEIHYSCEDADKHIQARINRQEIETKVIKEYLIP